MAHRRVSPEDDRRPPSPLATAGKSRRAFRARFMGGSGPGGQGRVPEEAEFPVRIPVAASSDAARQSRHENQHDTSR